LAEKKHVILVRLFGSVVEPALKPPSFQPLTCQGIAPSIGRRRKHSFFYIGRIHFPSVGAGLSRKKGKAMPKKSLSLPKIKVYFDFSLIVQ
jgi:hypothetical protein